MASLLLFVIFEVNCRIYWFDNITSYITGECQRVGIAKRWSRSTFLVKYPDYISFTDQYFVPVSCFLLFNLCDWGGRSLTAVCMWVSLICPAQIISRSISIFISPRTFIQVCLRSSRHRTYCSIHWHLSKSKEHPKTNANTNTIYTFLSQENDDSLLPNHHFHPEGPPFMCNYHIMFLVVYNNYNWIKGWLVTAERQMSFHKTQTLTFNE